MSKVIAKAKVQQTQGLAPAFSLAMNSDMDLEKLEKILDLQRRWESDQSVKAFNSAFAQFQQDMPKIAKEEHVNYTNKAGIVTDYWHSSLGGILSQIRAPLAENGLSISWTNRNMDGGMIEITAVLSHVDGHHRAVSMTGLPDQSGGKNSIQAQASTVSYLKRYTILMVIGADSEDDDGMGGDPIGPGVKRITFEQAQEIVDKVESKGYNLEKFIEGVAKKGWTITNMEELPVDGLEVIMAWADRLPVKSEKK